MPSDVKRNILNTPLTIYIVPRILQNAVLINIMNFHARMEICVLELNMLIALKVFTNAKRQTILNGC